jgi:hypothetical protein
MKIVTILFLAILSFPLVVAAQEPAKDREEMLQEQAALQARQLRIEDMEEQRLRLDKAIRIADAESAQIMKREILKRMEAVVADGRVWREKTDGIFTEGNPGQRMVIRMEDLLKSFEEFVPFPHDEATAQKANNLLSEFVALMGRAPF